MWQARTLFIFSLSALFVAGSACRGSNDDDDSGSDDANCPAVPSNGVGFYFDPSLPAAETRAESWLLYPFPADHRRTADGTIRADDMPGAFGALEGYITLMQTEMYGFGLNSAVHFALDGVLDTNSFPSAAQNFALASSPLQLIDITPTSPEYGTRRPLRWEYRNNPGRFFPANALAVAPEWGFPLRENTTYAMIGTRNLRDADNQPVRTSAVLQQLLAPSVAHHCLPDHLQELPVMEQVHAQFAPLRAWMDDIGLSPEHLVVATVFTTQNITSELADIYTQIYDELDAPELHAEGWTRLGDKVDPHDEEEVAPYGQERTFQWTPTASDIVSFDLYEGRYSSPNYQKGVLPYITQGGGLNFEDGQPEPVYLETLRFRLTIPHEPPTTASGCYPIVEYAHGTGGDAHSFVSDGTAGRLAARGIAGISIDQPMHGPRDEGKDVDVEVYSFNVLNPEAGRANFRQSAIDTFALTRFITESLVLPEDISNTASEICFDTANIGFMGHSHGALSGAVAAAYEQNIGHWMLSGGGGGLAITIMERKDKFDIEQLLVMLLELHPGEYLSELHPALTIIQTLVDITDPINYAPFWLDDTTYRDPAHVLVTSGEIDTATPYRTATAKAVAARMPVVAPVALPIPQYEALAMPPAEAPLEANINASVTAGFLQWADDGAPKSHSGHFLIFYRPEAIHASMKFFETAIEAGTPVIERNAAAHVR